MEKIKIRIWIPETKKMQFVNLKDLLDGMVPLNLKGSCNENMSLCINKKDTKGNDLYENDIVMAPISDRATYTNKTKSFPAIIKGDFEHGYFFELQRGVKRGSYTGCYPDFDEVTKIGNMFEHPHLFPVIPKNT